MSAEASIIQMNHNERRADGDYDSINPEVLVDLMEIVKQVIGDNESEKAFEMAIFSMIEIFGADIGSIILTGDSGKIEHIMTRNSSNGEMNDPRHMPDREIVGKVWLEKKPVGIFHDAGDKSNGRNGNEKFRSLSVLCLPLLQKGVANGVVYLERANPRKKNRLSSMRILEAYANILAPFTDRMRQAKSGLVEIDLTEEELRKRFRFEKIIGHDEKLLEIMNIVAQVADTEATVLINGASGTGKELIANALHINSSRRQKAFMPINCGALAENLLESELFGHNRGAYTGAISDKSGWFESASGGTIFLDEVNEMSPSLQVKLLRILQTGQYSRVGSTQIRQSNVRIVAATSKDLTEMIKRNEFREELYYRLNVIDIQLPPLRERKRDLRLLIQHFMKMYGAKYGKKNLDISDEVFDILRKHDFPGNVRELENIIERATILTKGNMILKKHLPPYFLVNDNHQDEKHTPADFKLAKKNVVENFEKEYIGECLKNANGNISRAAESAGIHFSNFYGKMKKYKLDSDVYKRMDDSL